MDLLRAERKIEGLEGSPAINSLLDTIVGATELVDGSLPASRKLPPTFIPRCSTSWEWVRPCITKPGGSGAHRCYIESRLPETELNLSTEVSTALFRIFQECLTNVARHARASKIEARLELEGGWVTLRVLDNGAGHHRSRDCQS